MNAQRIFFFSSSAAVLSTFIAAGYGSGIASEQLKSDPQATVEVKPCITLLLASGLGFGAVGIASAIAIPKAQRKQDPHEFDRELTAIINRLKLAAPNKREFYINQLIEQLGGDRFRTIAFLKAYDLIDEELQIELTLWADEFFS